MFAILLYYETYLLNNICILFFNKNEVYCQTTYFDYYRYTYKAIDFYSQNNYDSSAFYHLKAFYSIPNKKRFAFFSQAFYSNFKVNSLDKCSDLYDTYSCILTKETIYTDLKYYDTSDVLYSKLYSLYGAKCQLVENNLYTEKVPINEDSLFKALIKFDQMFRVVKDTGNKQISLDSVNFISMYNHFKKYGYSYNPKISLERSTLLFHLDNINKLKLIDEILLKAIEIGNLNPGTYAFMVDRCLISAGLKPRYYWDFIDEEFLKSDNAPKKDEIIEINKNRALIGLPYFPFWNGEQF